MRNNDIAMGGVLSAPQSTADRENATGVPAWRYRWRLAWLRLFERRVPTSFLSIPLPVRGRLYVSPMPHGPYDTRGRILDAYRRKGVQTVLVLVTDHELEHKARRDILKAYEQAGMEVLRMPFKDLVTPVYADMERTFPEVLARLREGRLAVHCNAGVGRTGVVAATLVAELFGCSGETAIDFIERRMQIWLTDEQKRFIATFAERRRPETEDGPSLHSLELDALVRAGLV